MGVFKEIIIVEFKVKKTKVLRLEQKENQRLETLAGNRDL